MTCTMKLKLFFVWKGFLESVCLVGRGNNNRNDSFVQRAHRFKKQPCTPNVRIKTFSWIRYIVANNGSRCHMEDIVKSICLEKCRELLFIPHIPTNKDY